MRFPERIRFNRSRKPLRSQTEKQVIPRYFSVTIAIEAEIAFLAIRCTIADFITRECLSPRFTLQLLCNTMQNSAIKK